MQTDNNSAQRIFNAPTIVLSLATLLIVIFAAGQFALSEQAQLQMFVWLGFWPIRFQLPDMPGGQLALVWSLVTHGFLHGSWSHVILNSLWLIVFGTPVARRYGDWNMLIVFIAGCVGGALTFAALQWGDLSVLVGASGGVAALTGTAMRFMFQPMLVARDPVSGTAIPLGRRVGPISVLWMDPRTRSFTLIWVGLNLAIPLYEAVTGQQGMQIAWQAHLGGFVVGVLMADVLKTIGPRNEHQSR